MPRKAILLSLILLFALPYAHADEATKRAKIEQMFKLIKIEQNMNQILDMSVTQSKQMVGGMFRDKKIAPADQKLIDDADAKVVVILRETIGWEKLRPAYIDLYASTYTEEEIDGILAFYHSPAGQSMLNKTPELMTKGNQIVSLQAREMQPKIRTLMEDLMKQVAAAHPDKAPAPK